AERSSRFFTGHYKNRRRLRESKPGLRVLHRPVHGEFARATAPAEALLVFRSAKLETKNLPTRFLRTSWTDPNDYGGYSISSQVTRRIERLIPQDRILNAVRRLIGQFPPVQKWEAKGEQ